MANRLKEDEKNERTIRSLLKLPENRRCINCNSLGPQYVCINFWTFVCTTCSGIHREFTHRVKSVSMAKFSSQEVSALQGGGNASAKEIYLKEWDPQRHSLPDSSNVERLRDFIKHVYVDRRYTGERSVDKPPRVKGEIEDENKRMNAYQGGSRSPPYEDTYERRYSDKRSPGGRSPAYEKESRQYGDNRRSPAHNDIVNDWRRTDRFGNGRKSDESRTFDGDSRVDIRSPDHQKDQDISSPPVVRPVREILGESVSPLRVIEPPKGSDGRSVDNSVRTQRTTSSSSLASSNENPSEIKVEGSLIDFDAVPDTPVMPQTQQSVMLQVQSVVPQTQQIFSNAQPTTNAGNWANFEAVAEMKVTQAAPKAGSLESLLSELSVPAPVSGPMPGISGNSGAPITANMSVFSSNNSFIRPMSSPFGIGAPGTTPNNLVPLPGAGSAASLPVGGGNSFVNASNGGQWSNMQHPQHTLFPVGVGQSNSQNYTQPAGPASGYQGSPVIATGQTTQTVLQPTIEVTSGVVTQSYAAEVRPLGRKELPADLFTLSYSSMHAPVPGWQTGQFHGIGFPMQYNMAVPMSTLPSQSKSSNPFDVNESPSAQSPMFPSMASLQGALPNMGGPTGLIRTSSSGTPSSPWIPPQSPTFASEMQSNSYMGQKLTNIPLGQQGVADSSLNGAPFGAPINPNQQPSGFYSAPSAANSSVGGNPFG